MSNDIKKLLNRQAMMVCFALASFFLCSTLLGRLADAIFPDPSNLSETARSAVELLIYLVSMTLPTLVCAQSGELKGDTLSADGFDAGFIVVFLGVCFVSQMVGLLMEHLLSSIGIASASVQPVLPSSSSALILYFFNYVLLPGFLEELFFRRVIISRLLPYGRLMAVVTSSLLFAAAHRNIADLPSIMLIGLVFGWMYVKTGSIIPSMLLHMLNNLFAMLLQVADTEFSSDKSAAMALGYLGLCSFCLAVSFPLVKYKRKEYFDDVFTDRNSVLLFFKTPFGIVTITGLALLLTAAVRVVQP